MTDLQEIAVEHYPCTRCGAQPGERCRVAKGVTQGRLTTWQHTVRTRGVKAAWRLGNRDARDIIMQMIETHGVDEALRIARGWQP